MKIKTSFQAVLFLVLMFFAFSEVSAQGVRGRARFTSKKKYWSFGGMITSSNFMGDLSPTPNKGSIDWSNTLVQFGGFVQRRYLPRISGRVSLNNNFFSGSDADAGRNADRGLEFFTYATQINVMGIIDLFPNAGVYYRRPKIPIPYIGLGIGGMFVASTVSQKPDPNYQGEIISGEQKNTEVTYVIPVALGVRYKLSTHLDIAFEATVNYAGSDMVDGINNEINGSTSSQLNDAFMTLGFSLNYILGGTIKMPKFR
ncbi:DUF6089 family protein [Flammeovirga kamogawensis]|uniref:DUF6089 domain-containing protein n=1 Tax=Flammeovirga kamogawensis TaxID=373891 RepID=A0ABX8GUM5_9BACT|nr:DUF6089 family protein [Flammeovirga kamogawensis]MBB6459957.1 hypothetical protein [Flammeovirga kamogawensis]QWG06992.1 hypothetical protein KM029_17075 [Flammeovirga kamogawensis]TRX68813.1 hypothetical protein EO216_12060 [Flammeovirga kamogawensis]